MKFASPKVPSMKIPGSADSSEPMTPCVHPFPFCGTRSDGPPRPQIIVMTVWEKSQEIGLTGFQNVSLFKVWMVGGSPNSLFSGAVSWVLLQATVERIARGIRSERTALGIIPWNPPGRLRPEPRPSLLPGCAGGPEGHKISDLQRCPATNAA